MSIIVAPEINMCLDADTRHSHELTDVRDNMCSDSVSVSKSLVMSDHTVSA